jgi:hypothetical protein
MLLEFGENMGSISSLSDKMRGKHCKDSSSPVVCSWKTCQTMKWISQKKDDPYWNYLLKTSWGNDFRTVLKYLLPLSGTHDIRKQDFGSIYGVIHFSYVVWMKKYFVSFILPTGEWVFDFIKSYVL